MLKKIAPRSVVILILAAAGAYVAAQYSWEGSDDGSFSTSSSESESSPSFSSEDSPYSYGSSEESGGSSASEVEEAASEAPKAEKQPKPARQPKAGRERASKAPGFSAAFEGPQKTCPVCASKRLKNSLYADHNGQRIHVCSAACLGRVRRNPAPFAKKLEKRGEQLAK